MRLVHHAWMLAPALCLGCCVDAKADPTSRAPPGPLSGLYAALTRGSSPAIETAAKPPSIKGAGPLRRRPTRHVRKLSLAALRDAHARALAAPRPSAFLNAALIYDYEVGRLYRIDASPRFLTTIALRPGEHLVSKAAGDTVRWVLGETVQGSGDTAQSLVLIKPVRGDLRTNVVLTTDQRSYFLDAVSHEEPIYTSIVSFNYPRDLALDVHIDRPANANSALAPGPQSIALEHLNFGYRIEHPHQKRGPPWEPERVFDDGVKTFIQFPESLSTNDAPPLFLLGPKDQAQLVNYHVNHRYYVVDRLIDKAELRLGENPQTVVRIVRSGAPG